MNSLEFLFLLLIYFVVLYCIVILAFAIKALISNNHAPKLGLMMKQAFIYSIIILTFYAIFQVLILLELYFFLLLLSLFCIVFLVLFIRMLINKETFTIPIREVMSQSFWYMLLIVFIMFILGVLSSIHDYLDFVGCRMY